MASVRPSTPDYSITATVAIGTSTTISGAVDLLDCQLCGIFIPSTFDGTTITFTACDTVGGTYVAVQDGAGATYTITTAAGKYVPVINLAVLAGVRFLKIVCGSAQTATDTVFILAVRPV